MKIRENYPKILFVLYVVVWVWAAINPNYRSVWVDENILTVLFVVILVISYKWFRFSNLSYTLLFIFMALHAIGGHYSYSEMPLFNLLRDNFGLMRNHYDRIVHFLFGVLFFLPVYEFIVRVFKIPEGWRGMIMAFFVVNALKGFFEIIEYGYVWVRADPLTVTNYLGEQGDSWDMPKDTLLGAIGSLIAWIILGLKSTIKFK